jgi:hypothetical protein
MKMAGRRGISIEESAAGESVAAAAAKSEENKAAGEIARYQHQPA